MTADNSVKKGLFTYKPPPNSNSAELSAWRRIINKIVIKETTHPDYPDKIAYSPDYSDLSPKEQFAIGVAWFVEGEKVMYPPPDVRKWIDRKRIKGVMGGIVEGNFSGFNVVTAPENHIGIGLSPEHYALYENQIRATRAARHEREEMNIRREILASLELENALEEVKSAHETIESLPQITRSEMAKNSANARHVKTYEVRKQVIAHWREHIPLDTSNEKAGVWLHDSFPELSVRKLSKYVSEAKKEAKEIPPAGKA